MGKLYLSSPRHGAPAKQASLKIVRKPDPLASRTYVKKQIRREAVSKGTFYTYQVGSSADYDSSPVNKCLTNIGWSDTANSESRTGNRVKCRQLRIRFRISNADALTVTRILVIQWKKDSNVTTPSTVIGGTNNIFSAAGGAGSEYLAPIFAEYLPYFNVLYDKMFVREANTGINSDLVKKIVIPGKRLRDLQFITDESTLGSNHIFFIAVSNKTNASADAPIVTMLSALDFDRN